MTSKTALHLLLPTRWRPATPLLLILFVLASASAAWAQLQPPSPGVPVSQAGSDRTVLSVKSQLVVLDVSVTDAHGRQVTDLRAEDFRVSEDKRPQTIRNFEPPSMHHAPSGASGAPAPIVRSSLDLPRIGSAPVTLIVLDEQNTSFEDEVYAREQVVKWLRTQPAVLKQPTLLTALTYTNFHVLLDTTQDRDRLLAVLEHHYATVPWRKENAGTVSGAASDLMASTLGALEQIAKSMRGLPGRKVVLWVGDGFPSVRPADIGSGASKQVFAELRHVDEELYHARVTLDVVGPTVKPPNHFTSMETLSEVLVGIVQFSRLDPEGSIAFANLAAPSGGTSYAGRNDLATVMEEAESNAESFYSFTYTPTNTSDQAQRYRKISVEVVRPGLQVHTRDGYFSEPATVAPVPLAKTSKQQLAFDFYGAANSLLPFTDLHVAPVHVDATHSVVQVRASDLTWQPTPDGQRKADEVILAVCFAKDGKMISRAFHDVGSNTTANDVQMLGRHVPLEFAFTVPPQATRIRFVVRDSGSGRVGTADAAP